MCCYYYANGTHFVSLKRFCYFRIRFASFLPSYISIWNVCECIHEKLVSKIYIFYIVTPDLSRPLHLFIHWNWIRLHIFQHTHPRIPKKKFVNIHVSLLKAILHFYHLLCLWINKIKNRQNSIEQLIYQFININSYRSDYYNIWKESLFSWSPNLKYYKLHASLHIKGNVMLGFDSNQPIIILFLLPTKCFQVQSRFKINPQHKLQINNVKTINIVE